MFVKLNQLLRRFGGRCIIVEDGEPRYVVVPVEEYLSLGNETRPNPEVRPLSPAAGRSDEAVVRSGAADDGALATEDAGVLTRLNRELEITRESEREPEQPSSVSRESTPERSEYRIEDIPF